MTPKLIKTEKDYEAALVRVEAIMGAKSGTPEGDELDLLTTLLEIYEKKQFPIDLPDPVAAIRFRMEQQGLSQQDLVRYIGSRSKVSEVLGGKRPLSLSMMRSLHEGLEIPAEVLLSNRDAELPKDSGDVDWDRFPLAYMVRRQWFVGFRGTAREARDRAEDLLRAFFAPIGNANPQAALNRQHIRSGSQMDPYALFAWRVRVLAMAQAAPLPAFKRGTVSNSFMKQLVQLSYLDEGPKLAGELLSKTGIAFVTLSHLPRTHLDGAAMLTASGNPVVALTLRHDRLDNFWFTLCHELAHIAKHLFDRKESAFIDDMDASGDNVEDEADRVATEWLIPQDAWARFAARGQHDASAVREFAASLRIHPAIVAGRIRRDEGNFRLLSNLVGQGCVQSLFPNIEGVAA